MREHKPSETSRAKVIALCTNGCTQDRIAEHLELAPKTLRRHYGRELSFGTEVLLSKVLNNLASIAIKGRGLPAVSAAKYLLSCRGGYKEQTNINLNPGADAMAYLTESASSADVRERILAKLAQLNAADDPANAREIIAARLDQLAKRNAEISGPEPSHSEANKSPEGDGRQN